MILDYIILFLRLPARRRRHHHSADVNVSPYRLRQVQRGLHRLQRGVLQVGAVRVGLHEVTARTGCRTVCPGKEGENDEQLFFFNCERDAPIFFFAKAK